MRVVLDTNVLVGRFLSSRGPPARIFDLCEKETFQLLVSPPTLEEYRRALLYPSVAKRHGLSEDEVDELLKAMARLCFLVNPTSPIHVLSRDPADDKFIECAVFGEAEFIVSGDAHLLDLGRYQQIEILAPAAFLGLIET